MKIRILVVLFLLCSLSLVPTTRKMLEDLLPPQSLAVDKDKIYFTSGINVSVFSLPDIKLVKHFGKKGEGPGEFLPLSDERPLLLDVESDGIRVTSLRKFSFFTKDGLFVKELKAQNGFSHKPLGKNYIALRFAQIDKVFHTIVSVYDKNFSVIKDLHKKKGWFQQGKSIDPTAVKPPLFYAHKGLAFTENGNGNIDIFDESGKKIAQPSRF